MEILNRDLHTEKSSLETMMNIRLDLFIGAMHQLFLNSFLLFPKKNYVLQFLDRHMAWQSYNSLIAYDDNEVFILNFLIFYDFAPLFQD